MSAEYYLGRSGPKPATSGRQPTCAVDRYTSTPAQRIGFPPSFREPLLVSLLPNLVTLRIWNVDRGSYLSKFFSSITNDNKTLPFLLPPKAYLRNGPLLPRQRATTNERYYDRLSDLTPINMGAQAALPEGYLPAGVSRITSPTGSIPS